MLRAPKSGYHGISSKHLALKVSLVLAHPMPGWVPTAINGSRMRKGTNPCANGVSGCSEPPHALPKLQAEADKTALVSQDSAKH